MSAPDPPCFLLNLQFTLRSRQRWVFCVNLLPERKDHGLVPPLNRTGAPNQAGMGWQRSVLDLLGSPIILPSQLTISRSHWRREIPGDGCCAPFGGGRPRTRFGPPAIARLALRTARVALYVTREDTNCWPGGQDSQGALVRPELLHPW
jgi:hypothetical protein